MATVINAAAEMAAPATNAATATNKAEGIRIVGWFGTWWSLSVYVRQVLGSSMGVCGLGSSSLFHERAQSLLMSMW